ncbi:UNKNOWN [Stylonychia lemnae]|uniref:6-bladed beta-propeller n=1 Tax=Stylonychia lemnae TaxID=5949 RepID=A0A078A1J4_STYLE|nr:UNKNOWN [Stylonychia lemnae]|eukprot:CDW75980.1 UNKNOWN [Stylonychia lemnae]
MSTNIDSTTYEPLIQPTRSSKIRKEAILAIATVGLIAVGFAQMFGQSDSQDFLGAKNQMSLIGVSQQINIPGEKFIDVYVDSNQIIGLTYGFLRSNSVLYKARAYNPIDRTWRDSNMEHIVSDFKVNEQEKRIFLIHDNTNKLVVFQPDGSYYNCEQIQDAALDSNGTIHAIINREETSDTYEKLRADKSGVKFYDSYLYKNIEIYQDKPVLVTEDGNLKAFQQLCVREISASYHNGGGLFALGCESQESDSSLYQLMRWNNNLNDWQNIDNVFAEKIATYSNNVVYIYKQSQIFEITINE